MKQIVGTVQARRVQSQAHTGYQKHALKGVEKKLLLLISSSGGHQPSVRQPNTPLHPSHDEKPPEQILLCKVNEPSVNFYPERTVYAPQLLDAPMTVPQHQAPLSLVLLAFFGKIHLKTCFEVAPRA